ncbi:PAQR family membrane homeostasis protein TrhA [Streptomyces sp. NBC_01198]|uniref:PAQR family membrane homeostasis protein TrhA n=1 Tax=Streptomyces sp. NBC_01198 TaxID=2903769 RepID=UPI002E1302C8|nr:hemolysin III family protein [Streptomyces sp. NBC_01198]
MIAEEAQSSAPGREPRHLSGATPDTFRAPAVDSAAGPTGRLSAGKAAADLEGGVEHAAAVVKPAMRGWLHAGMFPLALAGGIVLIALSRSAAAVAACAVYAVSALLLFGTSAVYHRGNWGARGEAVLRRLDHANIFLIIAGTYTPLAVLLLNGRQQVVLLSLVWSGAAAGIAFRVWWIRAPRWLYTLCYIALGWAAVFYLPGFARAGGIAVVVLVIAGGLLYTAGALVYGLKRPDPWPRWFGFHEVFHALTLAAFSAHYTAILLAAA